MKSSSGKRAIVPSGMLTKSWATISEHGVPSIANSKPWCRSASSWLAASTRARSGGSPSISATKATSAPKACASWRVSERKKASPVTVAVPAATACSRSLRPLAGSSGPVS